MDGLEYVGKGYLYLPLPADPSYSALSPLICRTDSNFTHPCPLLPCRPRALSHRVYLSVIHCMLVRAKLLPYDAPHAARLLSNTR